MTERPAVLVAVLAYTCKRCGKSATVKGDYTAGRKYPFSCCGVVQMAKA